MTGKKTVFASEDGLFSIKDFWFYRLSSEEPVYNVGED